MRLAVLCLLLLFLFLHFPLAAINPFWVRQDKKLIGEVKTALQGGPAPVEQYFAKHRRDTHNLGFGWTARDCAVAGGYVSVSATLYYHNGRLASCAVYPQLPDERSLRTRYVQWYAPAFPTAAAGPGPWYHNRAALSQPLAGEPRGFPSPRTTPLLSAYLSPESGLEYGTYGGYEMTLLANRKAFLVLRDSLSPEQVVLAMHALNPASRLTAIEFYLLNKPLFAHHVLIDQWMERVFRELPEVESLQGCIRGLYNARALVAGYTQTK